MASKIILLPGDGIGPEIIAPALEVLDAVGTNLDYEEWGSFLGNKSLVAALLSRLRHQCHTVKIDGPTLRDSTG